MKDAILTASVDTVIEHGLNGWTVEEVANRARCAKGLVNYHFKSKTQLLSKTAETIGLSRHSQRRAALTNQSGAPALDDLFEVLLREVRSGGFAAWLALVSAGAELERAAARSTEHAQQLTTSFEKALGLATIQVLDPVLVGAVLDGLELRLLHGEPEDSVREAYHRFWVGVL